jgi:hypothetical protein
MNLFGMMESSGEAMTAERVRAEVVAANMANAETTRTEEGGPYRRHEVVFAAGATGGGFLDSLNMAAGNAAASGGAGRRAYTWRRSSKILRRRSNATIRDTLTRDRMATLRIPTLIPSQRWWI